MTDREKDTSQTDPPADEDVQGDEGNDEVDEDSKESFPASDPPAW